MPSSTPRVGLSLSGGGYRATAFHLGTLHKLHELGLLSRIDILSTISGGSITGACYATSVGQDFQSFYAELYNGLQTKNVIGCVIFSWMMLRLILFSLLFLAPAVYTLFTGDAWLFPLLLAIWIWLLLKFQFYIFPVSKLIEKIYDRFFYNRKMLSQLPDRPILVVGSTNLQTAKPFTFSKKWMGDSAYEYLKEPVRFTAANFPVARAVMASSCVPFAFTPVKIDPQFFVNPDQAKEYYPLLVDGGVYDNQGIHKVVVQGRYDCDIVITSDAGGGSTGEMKFSNTISLLIETVNVFMSRIKKAQMVQNVYDNAGTANKEIAYFSLAWDVENCIPGFVDNLAKKQVTEQVIAAHALPQEWVADPRKFENEIEAFLKQRLDYAAIPKPSEIEKQVARDVGTNLTTLSRYKIDCLIKQAQALTELQVKLYCPSLF